MRSTTAEEARFGGCSAVCEVQNWRAVRSRLVSIEWVRELEQFGPDKLQSDSVVLSLSSLLPMVRRIRVSAFHGERSCVFIYFDTRQFMPNEDRDLEVHSTAGKISSRKQCITLRMQRQRASIHST